MILTLFDTFNVILVWNVAFKPKSIKFQEKYVNELINWFLQTNLFIIIGRWNF